MKLGRKHQNKQGRSNMKRTIIGIACAVVAPLAFAQTSTTTTETTTEPATTTQTTSTTYTAGTVTTYEPGKTVVVRGEQGPVSFALGTAARIVNPLGKGLQAPCQAVKKVRVYTRAQLKVVQL